jgi:hypothetical protein
MTGSDRGREAEDDESARERRIELLIQRLPRGFQHKVRWLRRPSARLARIAAGVLLILAGLLFFLPVFGLWMLPLGLLLLAEDIKPLRRGSDNILAWIEDRRPHWLGLAPAPPR